MNNSSGGRPPPSGVPSLFPVGGMSHGRRAKVYRCIGSRLAGVTTNALQGFTTTKKRAVAEDGPRPLFIVLLWGSRRPPSRYGTTIRGRPRKETRALHVKHPYTFIITKKLSNVNKSNVHLRMCTRIDRAHWATSTKYVSQNINFFLGY